MWIPQSTQQLEELVTQGVLEETNILDFKQEISRKSKDIAIDIAAMANDGGVICYGVAEDDQGRPTLLNPIPLTGQPERISSIARSAIAEPLDIEMRTLRKEDEPERGYLLVIVPSSPRAPHMVIVGGDQRYYGRSAKGNIPLGEGEVARLYERRKAWERERETVLDQVVAEAPCQPNEDRGFLHLFASPLLGHEDLIERVQGNQSDLHFMHEMVREVLKPEVFPQSFDPDFQPGTIEKISSGWMVYMSSTPSKSSVRDPTRMLDLRLDFDGSARLFCGRAADRLQGGELVVIEVIVAGLTVRFLTLMGNLYEKATYFGPVDVGVAVTGIEGATSYSAGRAGFFPDNGFDSPTYRRTSRVSSTFLVGNPKQVARDLLSRFFRAMTRGQIDPLKEADAK